MTPGPRILRRSALACACALTALVATGGVATARSTGSPAAGGAGGSAVFPGGMIRARGELVMSSIAALGLLMRTENVDDPTYVELRRRVAVALGDRLGVDSDLFDRAWRRVPRDHQVAVLAALTQVGVKYAEGKEEPHVRLDCSGLLWFAWRVAGVDMPRESVSQLDPRMRISVRDAVAGDIAGEGTHVHMYLGVDRFFVHAPFSGKNVTLKKMKKAQWARVAWTNPSNIATYRL